MFPATLRAVITFDGSDSSDFSGEFFNQTLLAMPTNPAAVFFGGTLIYRTTDSGNTWDFLDPKTVSLLNHHTLALARDNDTVYVGSDGGASRFQISTISSGAATFTALNNKLPVGLVQGIGPTSDQQLDTARRFPGDWNPALYGKPYLESGGLRRR